MRRGLLFYEALHDVQRVSEDEVPLFCRPFSNGQLVQPSQIVEVAVVKLQTSLMCREIFPSFIFGLASKEGNAAGQKSSKYPRLLKQGCGLG